MKNLVIYTDGAFSSSRDTGGASFVVLENNRKIFEYSNSFKRTTNNQMELIAIITAFRYIKEPCNSITIYSDSQYCIGGAFLGWSRKKNIKLWNEYQKQYDRVCKLCPNIEFVHIRGHQSDSSKHTKWNNYVDNLAVKASKLI